MSKRFNVELTWEQICIIKHTFERNPELDNGGVIANIFQRKSRYLKAFFKGELQHGCDWHESQESFERRIEAGRK